MKKTNSKQDGHGYYVVIPFDLVKNRDVHPTAKLLYGVIANLSNQKGYCYASNAYIADVIGYDAKSVSRYINDLCSMGWLRSEVDPSAGNDRRIFMGVGTSLSIPSGQIKPYPLDTHVPVNNTKGKNKENIPESVFPVMELHARVNDLRAEYDHEKLELTDSRRKLYTRLLKMYSLADLKLLADYRFDQLKSAEYRHYQVPETVFRVTKVEGWIAEAKSKTDGTANKLYTIY